MGKSKTIMAIAKVVKYGPEISDKICSDIEAGMSVGQICRQDGYPEKKSVYRWLAKHDEFLSDYRAAKISGIEALVDQMMDIANDASDDFKRDSNGELLRDKKGNRILDGEHVQRSRLRIDTIKWVATKLVPRLYGDNKHVEVDVKVGVKALTDDQLAKKITSLKDQLYGSDKQPIEVEFEEVPA